MTLDTYVERVHICRVTNGGRIERVQVLLTQAEKASLTEAAKQKRISLSAFLRQAGMERTDRVLSGDEGEDG